MNNILELAKHVKIVRADFVIDASVSAQTESDSEFTRYPPPDPSDEQALKLIEISGTLDFWNRPEEDGYTCDDGESL